MRRRRRLTAALSLALGAAALSVPAAAGPVSAGRVSAGAVSAGAVSAVALFAEPPTVISGDIVDTAGVLTPEETDELRQTLAVLPVEHDLRLTIVIVDSFDGLSGEEWTQQTFTLSYRRGGGGRALLALAVDERSYGYVERTILSTSRAEQLAQEEVAPLVEQGRWADAAMAAAEGHTVARSIGGPPLAPRLWALALAGFLLVAGVLVGLTLDRRRGAADALRRRRDETVERLGRATTELAELRAQEAGVDPDLDDRERHTHLSVLRAITDDLAEARETLAEVPSQIGWRGTRLTVIRGWAETVERAGDLISQAGAEVGQEREELEQVRVLLGSLARAAKAGRERARLAHRYAAVRDHTRAAPQSQAGVEPLLRAAEVDLTGAGAGLAEVRALVGERRLRPAHLALEEALARLAAADGWLDRAEEVRTGLVGGKELALLDGDGRMLLAGGSIDEHEGGA